MGTWSPDFPITAGAYQRRFGLSNNVAVARFSLDGRWLASTFLGGDGADRSEGVAVDASGNVHITGSTTSLNFPTTVGTFQRSLLGPRDAFVAVLSPDLHSLLGASLYGGSAEDYGRAVATGAGNITIIAGETDSSNLPNAGSAGRGWLGFMAKFVGGVPLP